MIRDGFEVRCRNCDGAVQQPMRRNGGIECTGDVLERRLGSGRFVIEDDHGKARGGQRAAVASASGGEIENAARWARLQALDKACS